MSHHAHEIKDSSMSDFLSSKNFTPSDLLSLGKRIREKRKEKHLTQRAFAKPLGISPNYLSEIEKGKKEPSEMVLRAIESRYAINYAWLTTGRGAEETNSGAYDVPNDGDYTSDSHTANDGDMRVKAIAMVDKVMSSANEQVKTALWTILVTFCHTLEIDDKNEMLEDKIKEGEHVIGELKKQVETLMTVIHPVDPGTDMKEM